MSDFHKIAQQVESVSSDLQHQSDEIQNLQIEQQRQQEDLQSLTTQVNSLLRQFDSQSSLAVDSGGQPIVADQNEPTLEELNHLLLSTIPQASTKAKVDKAYDMNKVDYLLACLAGAMGVIVDFLVVKIPKDVRFQGKYEQKGSSLTSLLRQIGLAPDGKTSNWVTALEEKFKVNYDISFSDDIAGLYPKNHRLYSLAHDPSPVGLLFAFRDLVTGSFSYIDKNGVLATVKVADADFSKLFTAPVIWFGHILSDLFTSMGVPVPGHCLLRTLQIGDLGSKHRTIGQMAEYMYYSGYDMRHLLTMSTVDAVVSTVVRLYHFLTSPLNLQKTNTISDRAYYELKDSIKLHNLLFTAYSVTVCGNIAKVCAYKGNPTAINYAVWAAFVKETLQQVAFATRRSKITEQVIEGRHLVDENFAFFRSMLDNNNYI